MHACWSYFWCPLVCLSQIRHCWVDLHSSLSLHPAGSFSKGIKIMSVVLISLLGMRSKSVPFENSEVSQDGRARVLSIMCSKMITAEFKDALRKARYLDWQSVSAWGSMMEEKGFSSSSRSPAKLGRIWTLWGQAWNVLALVPHLLSSWSMGLGLLHRVWDIWGLSVCQTCEGSYLGN